MKCWWSWLLWVQKEVAQVLYLSLSVIQIDAVSCRICKPFKWNWKCWQYSVLFIVHTTVIAFNTFTTREIVMVNKINDNVSILQHSKTGAQTYTPNNCSMVKSHTYLFYCMLVGNCVTPMRMRIELLSSNISYRIRSHYFTLSQLHSQDTSSLIPRLSTFSNGLLYLAIYVQRNRHGSSQPSQQPSSLPLLADVQRNYWSW